jgi:hypothetical protein
LQEALTQTNLSGVTLGEGVFSSFCRWSHFMWNNNSTGGSNNSHYPLWFLPSIRPNSQPQQIFNFL